MCVGELMGTLVNLTCVASASVREPMPESSWEFASLAGKISIVITIMFNDPIADLLTRIRNGYLSRLAKVEAPYSILKAEILRVLKKNNYIIGYTIDEANHTMSIELNDVRVTKYVPSLRRVSRPGQRIYIKNTDIKRSRNGLGIYILSTPKGIITGYEAHALGVGGELLCEIY